MKRLTKLRRFLFVKLCREHKDRVGEGRALYNLGNVYHAKGLYLTNIISSFADP